MATIFWEIEQAGLVRLVGVKQLLEYLYIYKPGCDGIPL